VQSTRWLTARPPESEQPEAEINNPQEQQSNSIIEKTHCVKMGDMVNLELEVKKRNFRRQ
jgi:hypothetical protein